MPRISQDQTQERHTFLLELFRQQPDIGRQEALDAFKERFGATLNAKTFSELRERALAEREHPARGEESGSAEAEHRAEAPVEEAAARLRMAAQPELPGGAAQPAKKPKAKGVGPRNVFIDAPAEYLQFLERVVGQLQEAGATNVRIDYGTERWMVLSVEPK
jgi:hypothetical protein